MTQPAERRFRALSVGDELALAADLAAGATDEAARLFAAAGTPPPLIVWSPTDAEIQTPLITAFAARCRERLDASGRLGLAAFREINLAAFADWLIELAPVEADRDFTYVRYGAEIAAIYGRDMTGARTTDFGGHIAAFFLSLYQAALQRGQWVFSVHEPPADVFVETWRRLIIPLFDEAGRPARIAVVNVPANELIRGLDAFPDAVMVLGADRRIVFANRAARTLFGPRGGAGARLSLPGYCGFDVDLGSFEPEPGALGAPVQIRSGLIGDSAIARFEVRVSGVFHRDRLFKMVIARTLDSG